MGYRFEFNRITEGFQILHPFCFWATPSGRAASGSAPLRFFTAQEQARERN